MHRESNAADFLASTVKPTVDEFLASPHDVRRARLAAIVLYHMADYVALESNTPLKEVCSRATASCSDFPLVRDVANATKHAKLVAKKKAALSSSSQVGASPGLFQAPFGEGVFAEAVEVLFTLDSGERRPLLPVLCSVLQMWQRKLDGESRNALSDT